jgi:hypothetical protein
MSGLDEGIRRFRFKESSKKVRRDTTLALILYSYAVLGYILIPPA